MAAEQPESDVECGELMAQYVDLGVLRRIAPTEKHRQIEDEPERR